MVRREFVEETDMSENEILDVLNEQGVDFIVATEAQTLRSRGEDTLALDILTNDSDANLVELNFALRELNGKRDSGEFGLQDIPTDVEWLREAPSHLIRCPDCTIHLAFAC